MGPDPERDHRRRVVLVDDGGPVQPVACQELLAVVVAGGDRLQLAVDAEPRLALVRKRLLGRLRAVLHLRDLELGHEPDAADADVRQLDVRLLEAARVLALVDVVEVGAHLLDQSWSIAPAGTSTRSS